MPENVAINPATGEIRVLSAAGEWEPAQRAQNPQTGAELYFDGSAWQPVPRAPSSVGRRLGLGVRDVVEGVTALPGLVYDLAAAPFNLAGAGIPPAREIVSGALDRVGLPRPATTGERLTSAVGQNVAGLIPTMGAGMAAPAASAARAVLTGAPASQVAGAVGAGLGAQGAAEAGADPLVQFGAGLAGGMAGAATVPIARVAGASLPAIVQPFSEAGRQQIATDVLLRNSDDPATLAARIAAGAGDQSRRLPGSVPTTAQAGRDAGLSVLEGAVRSSADAGPRATFPSGAATVRAAEAARLQNRWKYLTGVQGNSTPEQRGQVVRGILQANQRATGDAVSQLYQAIDPNGATRFPVAPIQRAADAAVARFDRAAMGGGVPAPLQGVIDDLSNAVDGLNWRAMQNLRSRLGSMADEASRAGDNRLAGAATMIRASLDQAETAAIASGGMEPWQADLWKIAAAARRHMGQMFGRAESGAAASGEILRTAGFGMPALLDARVVARALQSPADLRQVLQASGAAQPIVRRAIQEEFMARLLNVAQTTSEAASAGTATPILTNAAVQRFMRANADQASQLFGTGQRALLGRLLADFSESAMVTATGRARGSDTAQNLSVGNAIARTTNGLVDPSSPLAQTMFGIGGAMRLLYAAPEAATRELLVRAVVDPQFASMLLAKATPANIQRAAAYVDKNLADRLAEIATNAAGRATLRGATAAATAEAP